MHSSRHITTIEATGRLQTVFLAVIASNASSERGGILVAQQKYHSLQLLALSTSTYEDKDDYFEVAAITRSGVA